MTENPYANQTTDIIKKKYKMLNTSLYGLYGLIILLGLIMVAMMLQGLPPYSLIPVAISVYLINKLLNFLGKKKLKMIEELNKRM